MPTYQGPNTQVTQVFETTPGAIAIENLPSAVVATPYEVKAKEDLGDAIGILPVSYSWVKGTGNKVIYDDAVAGADIYDFFPVKFYARDGLTGEDYDISTQMGTKTATSTPLPFDGTDDAAFTLRTVASGSSNATMPYYKATTTNGVVIAAATPTKVTVTGGRFVDAGIRRGQEVIAADTVETAYINLGIVDRVESNTVLYLQAAFGGTTPLAFNYIVVGSACKNAATGDTTFNPGGRQNLPGYIYDTDADFNQYRRGDMIVDASSVGLGTDIAFASITNIITKNLIEIFTGAATSGNQPGSASQAAYSLYDYFSSATTSSTATFTPSIDSYLLKRFVGFTGKYTTTENVFSVSANQVVLSATSVQYKVGDYFGFTDTVASKIYKVVQTGINDETYILDQDVSGESTGALNLLYAFKGSDDSEIVRSEILADYRSVEVTGLGTVLNSSDNQLTGTDGVYGEASVYNELSFMVNTILGLNGSRVLYAVSVDPTQNLASEYANALEALEFYDVYSHCFGTSEAGINALIPSYVDAQSAPYEGHERIGVLAYNDLDVYRLGADSGPASVTPSLSATGLVTTLGTVDLRNLNIGIGDTVTVVLGTTSVTATVTDTPASASTVQTDYTGTAVSFSATINFYAGTGSKKAQKVRALGATSNRRITVVWPGSFQADTLATSNLEAETSVTLPPYFLSAAVCGLDGGQKVSQSFTKLSFAMPGLSNIRLATSSAFKKVELDTIGGGGIDILMQSSQVSNLIYSRHDLTTDMSAIEYRERSASKQADQAAKTYRAAVNPYIGKYNITTALLEFLTNVLNNAKKGLIKNGVVKGIENKGVVRDPEIADKVNMKIKITIFVAANYYDITLTVVS